MVKVILATIKLNCTKQTEFLLEKVNILANLFLIDGKGHQRLATIRVFGSSGVDTAYTLGVGCVIVVLWKLGNLF